MKNFFKTFFLNSWHASLKIASGLLVSALTVVATGTIVGLPSYVPILASIVLGMATAGGIHAVHLADKPQVSVADR